MDLDVTSLVQQSSLGRITLAVVVKSLRAPNLDAKGVPACAGLRSIFNIDPKRKAALAINRGCPLKASVNQVRIDLHKCDRSPVDDIALALVLILNAAREQ